MMRALLVGAILQKAFSGRRHIKHQQGRWPDNQRNHLTESPHVQSQRPDQCSPLSSAGDLLGDLRSHSDRSHLAASSFLQCLRSARCGKEQDRPQGPQFPSAACAQCCLLQRRVEGACASDLQRRLNKKQGGLPPYATTLLPRGLAKRRLIQRQETRQGKM